MSIISGPFSRIRGAEEFRPGDKMFKEVAIWILYSLLAAGVIGLPIFLTESAAL